MTVLVGDTTETYNDAEFIAAGHQRAWKFGVVSSDTIDNMTFRCPDAPSTATSVKLGVYSDSAGAPDTLLGSVTYSGAIPRADVFTVAGLSIVVGSGDSYWLAVLPLGGTLAVKPDSGSNDDWTSDSAFGSLQATWPTTSSGNKTTGTASIAAQAADTGVLLGSTGIVASNTSGGNQEAFAYTATASGTVTTLKLRTSAEVSTSTAVELGIYTDSSGPATLLDSGTVSGVPAPSSWIEVTGLSASVTAGQTYWLAMLPADGLLYYNLPVDTGGTDDWIADDPVVSLQSPWPTTSPGNKFTDGPIGFYAEGGAPSPSYTRSTRRAIDARLTVTITKADGSKVRWAEDERDPKDQPSGLNFGTVKPGGFGAFSLTLPRGLDPGPDENLLDTVKITGAGGRVAFEGRIHRLPRNQGDTKTVTVQGVGWASHLSDNRAMSALIIDRTLSAWTDPSAARQGVLALAAFDFSSPQVSNVFDATNGPGISVLQTGPIDHPLVERWYDAGPGQQVARIKVDHQHVVGFSTGDASLAIKAYTATDDQATSTSSSSDQKANSSIDFTAGTANRYALLQIAYSSSGGTSPNTYGVQWQQISAHGDHGLTLTDSGYTASDILRYLLPIGAPLLNFTDATIPDSTFGISQAVYAQTSLDQVILDVNKYELRPWYVWENKTFYYPDKDDPPVVWEARLADGAKVGADGEDVVQLASSAYVYFTDEYGRPRVYAPTGGTGDYTSDDLLGDGLDAYTLQGINAPITFTLNFPCPAADALQIGRLWLAELNAPKHSGSITLAGFVRHPTEGLVPSWRVRAGDSIIVTDRQGDEPRPIVSTSYDHPTRTNTVTLEAGPLFRLDGLVQRLAVTVGALNQ